VAKPGASTDLTVEIGGMTLDHYAEMGRLLEPFGGQIKSVNGDSVTYKVTASADQIRSQMALAKLQEVQPPAPAPVAAPVPPAAPAPVAPAAPANDLHFHY
jgi:hypothetical protein